MRGSAAKRRSLARRAHSMRSGPGKRIHIVEIKVQIVLDRAEFARLRQPGEGIFFGDLDQRHRAFDKLANSLRGQVAGAGRSRALAQKHAQTQPARAGFLQRLHFAHAHVDAELVAFAGYGLGVAGAGLHGLGNHVGGQGFEVEAVSSELCCGFRHMLKLSN